MFIWAHMTLNGTICGSHQCHSDVECRMHGYHICCFWCWRWRIQRILWLLGYNSSSRSSKLFCSGFDCSGRRTRLLSVVKPAGWPPWLVTWENESHVSDPMRHVEGFYSIFMDMWYSNHDWTEGGIGNEDEGRQKVKVRSKRKNKDWQQHNKHCLK